MFDELIKSEKEEKSCSVKLLQVEELKIVT
jgi:hypothetical protein